MAAKDEIKALERELDDARHAQRTAADAQRRTGNTATQVAYYQGLINGYDESIGRIERRIRALEREQRNR